MGAVPVHHTGTDDGPWDGPAQVKKLNTPLTAKIGDQSFRGAATALGFVNQGLHRSCCGRRGGP